VEIVVSRDDFSERGSATRSTLASRHRSNYSAGFPHEGLLRVTDPRSALVAAQPRCAVSRIFNPLNASMRSPADCKSAIQITNLRYGGSVEMRPAGGQL